MCKMVGHAMGKGHALGLDQIQQHIGRVAPRINLLHAHGGGRIGKAPGMDVEHRRDRHVYIVAMETALTARRAQSRQFGERMQHELTMAEIDAFR